MFWNQTFFSESTSFVLKKNHRDLQGFWVFWGSKNPNIFPGAFGAGEKQFVSQKNFIRNQLQSFWKKSLVIFRNQTFFWNQHFFLKSTSGVSEKIFLDTLYSPIFIKSWFCEFRPMDFLVSPTVMVHLLLFWKDRARTILSNFTVFLDAKCYPTRGKDQENAEFSVIPDNYTWTWPYGIFPERLSVCFFEVRGHRFFEIFSRNFS